MHAEGGSVILASTQALSDITQCTFSPLSLHCCSSSVQATRDFAVEAAQLSEALAQKEEEVQMTGERQ